MKKWIVIGVVVLLAVIVNFWPEDGGEVSELIFGSYIVDDPRYEGRRFELSEQIVVFGTGNDDEVVYTLTDIKQFMDDGRSLYTITFLNDGGAEIQKSFYFDDRNQGRLEFKNNPDVQWARIEDDQ